MREASPGGRIVPMCYVGYRVYRTAGRHLKTDSRGTYEGWGSRYDEWVAMFSPYIAMHKTKPRESGGIVPNHRKLDE